MAFLGIKINLFKLSTLNISPIFTLYRSFYRKSYFILVYVYLLLQIWLNWYEYCFKICSKALWNIIHRKTYTTLKGTKILHFTNRLFLHIISHVIPKIFWPRLLQPHSSLNYSHAVHLPVLRFGFRLLCSGIFTSITFLCFFIFHALCFYFSAPLYWA